VNHITFPLARVTFCHRENRAFPQEPPAVTFVASGSVLLRERENAVWPSRN
jgi:hypothetical protein